ncbi:carboxymuconolactone decarboxylase family protein [Saccharopolyspora spinosa]|uniref:carboxymuconolactone decarboxylase family protein n=1 Tax=Saccharopolyspora spinosa TaxID=60894 RepID=UPI0002378948
MLDGFLKLSAMFEASTLDAMAREVVILTIATRNECHFCVAMHTARLTEMGASPEIIAALRARQPLGDPVGRRSGCSRSRWWSGPEQWKPMRCKHS